MDGKVKHNFETVIARVCEKIVGKKCRGGVDHVKQEINH